MSWLGENILLKSELMMNVDICVKLGRVKKQKQKQTKYFRHGFNKGNWLSFWRAKTAKLWLLKEQTKSEAIVFDQQVACTFQLELTTHTDHFTENIDLSVWTTEELFLLLPPFSLLHQLPLSTSAIGVQVKTFTFPFWFFYLPTEPQISRT